MARWVIPDYNIMEFLKGLKAMSKVGPEVHIEPFGDRGLKLQTTNAARSVYFQILYKSDYFQENDEQSQTQSSSDLRCKLPMKYLLKCSSTHMGKNVDRIEFYLSDLTFTYTIYGNEDWVKKFSFNVFAADNITTDYDMSQRNPFLRCPVQVIEGQISTFPRGILEVTMWLEGEKLHFKSYNEAALRSSVRSQVFIPMEDLELMNEITGPLTFSLRELVAGVTFWDCIAENSDLEVFESGSGRPLIFQIESNTVLSSLVTATLKLDASETLDDQLVNQSYLDQSVGRIKKRKSSHVEPEVNQPTKKQNRNRKKLSPRLPSPVRMSPVRNAEQYQGENERTVVADTTAHNLLFGSESDSSDSESSIFGVRGNFGNSDLGLMESAVEETQSQRGTILCYDST